MGRLSTTPVWAFTFASLAACDSGSAVDAGSGGSAGTGGGPTATSGSTGATTGVVSAVSTGAGGSMVAACDPPVAPGSFYERTAETMGLEQVSMCGYRGDVLLVVNIAAV